MDSITEEQFEIAIVDDDPIFLDLTCALLSSRPNYRPLPAASGKELFAILNSRRVDCILMDYNLTGETGLDVKRRLDQLLKKAAPVIMLTGSGQEKTAIEAFRMGVSDYIPKIGMTPDALFSTVSKVIAGERQTSNAKAEHGRLAEATKTDPVTGLPGRLQFDQELELVARLDPAERRLHTILRIELNEYASIKDYFGSEIADAALRAFSDKLKKMGQPSDVCARLNEGRFGFIKKFDAPPSENDLRVIRRRLSEYLASTITTAFSELKLSADVAVVPDR